jgi:hypothetical protein
VNISTHDLPLPPADADYVNPTATERSASLGGFTLEQARYNCRVSTARRLAQARAEFFTPDRDRWARFLSIFK